jgi:hypothetical protein
MMFYRVKLFLIGMGCFGLMAVGGWLVSAQEGKSEAAAEPEVDEMSGLVKAPGWELVRNNCITCHSARQFLTLRGNRETWRGVLRWMQERAGLWPLEPEVEEQILTYLADQSGPTQDYRRSPIPAHLMPPNPYVSDLRKEFESKQKNPN